MDPSQHIPIEELNLEPGAQPMASFNYQGQEQKVSYIETMQVTNGVECEVYTFPEDPSKDLGIIRIEPGKKTPLQKVLKGEKTVEGYISGKGKLTITHPDDTETVFRVDGSTQEPVIVTVNIGETMQWEADKDSDLVAFEICIPPYEDGRFENVVEAMELNTNSNVGMPLAKAKALALLGKGDIASAVNSMEQDLNNDPATADQIKLIFSKAAVSLREEKDPEAVRGFIEGFPF